MGFAPGDSRRAYALSERAYGLAPGGRRADWGTPCPRGRWACPSRSVRPAGVGLGRSDRGPLYPVGVRVRGIGFCLRPRRVWVWVWVWVIILFTPFSITACPSPSGLSREVVEVVVAMTGLTMELECLQRVAAAFTDGYPMMNLQRPGSATSFATVPGSGEQLPKDVGRHRRASYGVLARAFEFRRLRGVLGVATGQLFLPPLRWASH
jgi:hypothetical protein